MSMNHLRINQVRSHWNSFFVFCVDSKISNNNVTIKTTMSTTPSVIKVNVGGQLFQTTSSTLHASEFFTRLLDGAIPTLKDENGAYFIDRDPKYFEVILSYLRTYNWDIQPSIDKDLLLQEAEFYMVKTDLAPTPKLKDPVGLYIGPNGHRLFIEKDMCLVSCDTDVQWITPNAQNIYLDNTRHYFEDRSSFTSGIFVNNNTQFIMTQTNYSQKIQNYTTFLGICPPKRPAFVRIKYPLDECAIIATHTNAIISNDDGTLIECNYNVDPETNLLYILHEGLPFTIKAYFFDAYVAVVSMNGSWKFVNAGKGESKKQNKPRATSTEGQAQPKSAISYSYSYDYDKY